jgi:serine/threonine-protein kinase
MYFRHNLSVPVSTLAGSETAGSSNGIGTHATFSTPRGIAISRSGAFAVATDAGSHRVRIIDLITSQVSTLAGSGNDTFVDGQGTHASFSVPEGVAISPDDSFALIFEGYLSTSSRVRHIVIATGVVTTLAGNGPGNVDGVGTLAKFQWPRGGVFSPDGAFILIADLGNVLVRRLDMSTKVVTTVAGSNWGFADGIGSNANFNQLFQIAFEPTGMYAFMGDVVNRRIRRIHILSAQVTTFAGSGAAGFQDGVGTNALFTWPHGFSMDPSGMYALIVDAHRVRRIVIATARVTTLAGTGAASFIDTVGALASFNNPHAISIHVGGSFALVADAGNNRIRRIALSSPPCSAGFYCPSGSSSPTQVACAPGFFCASGSAFTLRGAIDGQGMGACCIWFVFSTQ